MRSLKNCPSRELVSVIVPTLNDAHRLGPLLASVAAQNYRPLELIIVDGGSRDDTIDLLNRTSVVQSEEFSIKVVCEADFGELRSPGNARNIGVEAGHGDYIVFLDSDMRFAEPWAVRKIREELDGYDFTRVLVRIALDTETERYLASFLPSPHTHHCGFRRSVFGRVKFDPLLGLGEDKDFWFRASNELGLDMDHTCSAVVTRHLPHTKLEYLKQTAWYFRTLPRFAIAATSRHEHEYVPEVLGWLRYCAYVWLGPLVFLTAVQDWIVSGRVAGDLCFRLFESTARRYVAAFNLFRGAVNSKSLSFITRLATASLSSRWKEDRPRSSVRVLAT
jgi:hypothetical protein